MKKALLLENIHADAAVQLRDEGFLVETLPHALSEDDLAEKLRQDVVLLGVRSRTQVTRQALRSCPSLLAVGSFCIGTDNVDVDACLDRGIAAFNAPYSNTRSVAELIIGEIIMLLRGVFDKSRALHEGVWLKSSDRSREIRGKRLGIVGYGNIGSQVGSLAEALGMEVWYYDIREKLSLGNAKRCRSMREVLRKADVITVHVDDAPKNAGLFGDAEFRAMRPEALFLNASRGSVADLAALAKHLKSGKLAGAAVDVFPKEPKRNGEKFVSPLTGLDNVLLTPHIGGSTQEAQRTIAAYVSDKLSSYFKTGDTFYSVNFPQVHLPILKDSHRLLHIHRNVPGVMSQIDSILASEGINISGQYLETNRRIGYAITDIGKKYDAGVLKALEAIPETIRLRLLF